MTTSRTKWGSRTLFILMKSNGWKKKALTYEGQGVDCAIDGSEHPFYEEKI